MYKKLYEAWLKETRDNKLQQLPRKFYVDIASYISDIKKEGRMLDRGSIKAKLSTYELSKVKNLVKMLFEIRFNKILSYTNSALPFDKRLLTQEEEKLLLLSKPPFEKYNIFLKDILNGKMTKVSERIIASRKIIVRFLQDIDAIIGSDLKVYGPFRSEDVAPLPIENAKVLINQGIAMQIESN